jgi:hypothetical protein
MIPEQQQGQVFFLALYSRVYFKVLRWFSAPEAALVACTESAANASETNPILF